MKIKEIVLKESPHLLHVTTMYVFTGTLFQRQHEFQQSTCRNIQGLCSMMSAAFASWEGMCTVAPVSLSRTPMLIVPDLLQTLNCNFSLPAGSHSMEFCR